MAYIYSMTAWPDAKNGRPHEYLDVYGCRIIVPVAKVWTKIPDRMSKLYHTDWIDAKGPYHADVHYADRSNVLTTTVADKVVEIEEPSLADAIEARYGRFGLAILKSGDPESKKDLTFGLIKKAKESFDLWVTECIENFTAQREEVKVRGGIRLVTQWERYCFDYKGIPVPSSVAEMQDNRKPVEVTVNLSPEMIQNAIEKATAPAQPLAGG